MINYQKYIEVNSTRRFSMPTIMNTRISVYDILNWLAAGMTEDEIISDFPELTSEHIEATLTFAANRENRIRVAS